MMSYRIPVAALTVFIVLIAGACSSSSSDSGASTTVADMPISTTAPDASAGADTTTPDTTQATTTTVVEEPAIAGADLIELLTPMNGGGRRPLLEWESIDGAALYFVAIFTETGSSYWAAVTEETKTYVGGPLQIPAGRTGPNVSDGYTWVVYAEDADGTLLAVSAERPIAP